VDAPRARAAGLDQHNPRLMGKPAVQSIGHESVACAHARGHGPVPILYLWRLDKRPLDRGALRGIDVARDALARPRKVRMRVKARIQEGERNPSPCIAWIGAQPLRRSHQPGASRQIRGVRQLQQLVQGNGTALRSGLPGRLEHTVRTCPFGWVPVRMQCLKDFRNMGIDPAVKAKDLWSAALTAQRAVDDVFGLRGCLAQTDRPFRGNIHRQGGHAADNNTKLCGLATPRPLWGVRQSFGTNDLTGESRLKIACFQLSTQAGGNGETEPATEPTDSGAIPLANHPKL
jgi:hypothetical protein